MEIISSGIVYVSGTTSTELCVIQEGALHILNDGMAKTVVLADGGKAVVSRGGILYLCTVSGGGTATVLNSGYAQDITVENAGLYLVSSGGTAHRSIILSGGTQVIFANTMATSATVLDGGRLQVNANGFAYVPSVSQGGALILLSGLANSARILGSAEVDAGAALNYATALDSGRITVLSKGYAYETEVNSGGSMSVSNAGSANFTILHNGGTANIEEGGGCGNTTVGSGGTLRISGGMAGDTTVSGGAMQVLNGGTATVVSIAAGGTLTCSDGASVNSISLSDGTVQILNGGTASGATVSGGAMQVLNGGTASRTTISGGALICSDGASLNSVTLSDGSMRILDGGTASRTTVSGGTMQILNGGTAGRTTVSGGTMQILNGGTATEIDWTPCVGTVEVEEGAIATFVSGYSGVYYGSGGQLLSRSELMESMEIDSGGEMYVMSGGTVVGIALGSGGRLIVSGGGKLTGQMTFGNGATVSATPDALLDFDLTQTASGATALLNDLSAVRGMPGFTLTIREKQYPGEYRLAEGASGFDGTITVMNASDSELGTISVGQTLRTRYSDYTLGLNESILSLTVVPQLVPGSDPVFFAGCFGGGNQAMLAKESNGLELIYKNGAIWGTLALDSGWHIAGTGDFDGDGLDDLLRINGDGDVIGEFSNGNGWFTPQPLNHKQSGWDILGMGDFDGNGVDDVLITNPTAASETVGLIGYWEGGVTWTLINGYSPEWEMLATGDFNSDGKCDMLWRNTFAGIDGTLRNAYCTWIVDPLPGESGWRMVSVADPYDWTFLCAGDFDGNGAADIAMINDVGVVGIWGVSDGYLNSWSILSAVDTSGWSLAAVGDFNADGTDDIAWRNASGLTGYWQINGMQLTAWQSLGKLD